MYVTVSDKIVTTTYHTNIYVVIISAGLTQSSVCPRIFCVSYDYLSSLLVVISDKTNTQQNLQSCEMIKSIHWCRVVLIVIHFARFVSIGNHLSFTQIKFSAKN